MSASSLFGLAGFKRLCQSQNLNAKPWYLGCGFCGSGIIRERGALDFLKRFRPPLVNEYAQDDDVQEVRESTLAKV